MIFESMAAPLDSSFCSNTGIDFRGLGALVDQLPKSGVLGVIAGGMISIYYALTQEE